MDNNATDGGGLYVSDSSRVAEYSPKHSTSTSTHGSYSTRRDANAKMLFLENTVQISGGGCIYRHNFTVGLGSENHIRGKQCLPSWGTFHGALCTCSIARSDIVRPKQRSERRGDSRVGRLVFHASISMDGAPSIFNNIWGGSGGPPALFVNTHFSRGIPLLKFQGTLLVWLVAQSASRGLFP